ncbi:MAG: M2 family metallopeptidase, partial [Bryobacteraceae bacterium]
MRIRVFAVLLLSLFVTSILQAAGPATVQEARVFLKNAEAQLMDLSEELGHASWVQVTYINTDTEMLAAKANERLITATVNLAKKSRRFDGLALPPELARKMKLLRLALSLAAPSDPKESGQLTRIAAAMEGAYGKGKYCPARKEKCLDVQDIGRIMGESRDPAELLDVWRGWQTISPPIRKDFTRYVELANKGARELGFADTGAMWRSKYDMPPAQFAQELDRLWEQVKPLYVSLHAYVRWKLREKYGDSVVPANGPIPAHLLGNIWAQSWENIYPLVAPKDADPGYDLTQILKERKASDLDMARYGERFFTSLGFAPLPQTFWERSLFRKPQDREVVCHASAWDVDNADDLRIKMCIEITGEDFATIHHELG